MDTLYLNATIYTMTGTTADAMLVRDGRIAAIGIRSEVEGSGARQVDLAGRAVIPGFNDCHCHILSFGLNLSDLDLSPDAVRNIEDIKRALAARVEAVAEGAWVIGQGYDQNRLEERRHPTRHDLDAAVPHRPAVLWHTSGHALTCNSRALEAAGITRDTPNPPGGEIDRDERGEPTGVMKESAMDAVGDAVPPPTYEQGTEAIVRAMSVMAAQGITSATDAATGEGEDIDRVLRMYRGALSAGTLGRMTVMPQIKYVAPPDSNEVHSIDEFDAGTDPLRLRIGATKIFSDGALTTRTAALREPYVDSAGNTGILIWEPQTLASMIARAHRAGWQIGTHAIGDRAIDVVLDCYEAALRDHPRTDPRHRIEHCMLLDEGAGRRIKALGVVPTIQPGFMSRLGDAYIAGLGMERAARLIPMGLFARLGIPSGLSSDRPVIPGLPLQGVEAAVRRTTPLGTVLGRDNAVSPLEAIRLYTVGSAYAERRESELGTLAPGMLADFTVLSADPAAITEAVPEVRPVMTVVGGEEIWRESGW